MSAKSTRQIQCHAWLRERWIHKPLVGRDEERIGLCQRRQALLVLDIPTGSLIFTLIVTLIFTLIFTLIVTMLFAAHADPFLTMGRRASPPGWTGEDARPSIDPLIEYRL